MCFAADKNETRFTKVTSRALGPRLTRHHPPPPLYLRELAALFNFMPAPILKRQECAPRPPQAARGGKRRCGREREGGRHCWRRREYSDRAGIEASAEKRQQNGCNNGGGAQEETGAQSALPPTARRPSTDATLAEPPCDRPSPFRDAREFFKDGCFPYLPMAAAQRPRSKREHVRQPRLEP